MPIIAPKEIDIQNSIRKYLESLGYTVFRSQISGTLHQGKDGRTFAKKNDMAGFPDLLVPLRKVPKLLAIEVKRPGGKLSDRQSYWNSLLNRKGVHAIVAYCIRS